MNDVKPVGVALSGGGGRALLFGLGALRAVIAARTAGVTITTLVGVSGGALAAAYAHSRQDLQTAALADYDEEVLRPAVRAITTRSMMFGAREVWAVIVLAVAAIAVFGALVFWGFWLPLAARIPLSLLALYALVVILGWRGWAIEQGIRRTLFPTNPDLTQRSSGLLLVLQATDLGSGEATYLTSRGVSSWRWGDAKAGRIKLVRAARAAATFPGVLPALHVSGLVFVNGHEDPPKRLSLVDGGVYDNMGSEWLLNPDRTPSDVYKVVVNASQNLAPRKSGFGTLGIGELRVLLREKDIQYDATTAPRRRWLIDLFKHKIQTGTLVLIDGHIERWVSSFTKFGDEKGARARALLPLLRPHRSVWRRWHDKNGSVSTSLSRVARRTAADLVRAGFMATAIQTHILDGWPPPESADPSAILPWLDGETENAALGPVE